MRRASSCVVTNARTSRSASAISLISCSTSASTEAGTAEGEAKSKRNRPGSVQRARLRRLLAQGGPERLVHQVRRGVRARDRPPALDVDLRVDGLPDPGLAGDDPPAVHHELAERLLHVVDLHDRAVAETMRPASASWPPPSA
jgi:hypothetical protein